MFELSALVLILHSQEVRQDDKVFYGVHAPEEVFNKYKYLLKVSDSCNWSAEHGECVQNTTRSVKIPVDVICYILVVYF